MSKLFIFFASLSIVFQTIYSYIENSSSFKGLELHQINDGSINTLVGDGKGSNYWILMFYVEQCPYCKKAKDAFRLLAGRDELADESFANLKIGQIDCTYNNWSCLRFNITRVPTVYLIEHEKLFEFKYLMNDENLLKFLADGKIIKEGKEVPPPLGFMQIISYMFTESVAILDKRIEKFFTEFLNLEITWSRTYTIIVLIAFMVSTIVIEYYIIERCCFSNRGHKVNEKKENRKEVKEELKEEPKKEDGPNKEKKE
jgi:hypothetical protein